MCNLLESLELTSNYSKSDFEVNIVHARPLAAMTYHRTTCSRKEIATAVDIISTSRMAKCRALLFTIPPGDGHPGYRLIVFRWFFWGGGGCEGFRVKTQEDSDAERPLRFFLLPLTLLGVLSVI